MNTRVQKVIEELGNEVLILARKVLTEQGISDRSQLYKDVRVEIDSRGDSIVVDTYFNNYIQFVENGRAPKTGKRPPIEALKHWAESRGIPTDNDTLHAISYAIWRDGVEGKPILATLEQRIEEYMEREFYDKLSEAIISELNKYFE